MLSQYKSSTEELFDMTDTPHAARGAQVTV